MSQEFYGGSLELITSVYLVGAAAEHGASFVVLGQFVDEDHKAEELQDVAHGARHDCRRVREPHLLVRPGAQILEVAVHRLSKRFLLGCVTSPPRPYNVKRQEPGSHFIPATPVQGWDRKWSPGLVKFVPAYNFNLI